MKQHPCMKIIQNALTAALILGGTMTSPAYASGGVSDGGGGTTNPNSAKPEWIVGTASLDAGKILLLWLNAEEANFGRKSESDQAASPFKKLFGPGKNIFDVVRAASIELRMSEPCYDKNGVAWEGSIVATQPGAICLSPFLMAPKLSEINYQAETVALIAHELSHLLGTTEDEARAIQKSAIYDLAHSDFIDLAVNLDRLADVSQAGRFANLYMEIQFLLDTPGNQQARDVERINTQVTSLRDDSMLQFLRLQAIRESTVNSFFPQFLRLQMIEMGVCAADSREDPGVRQYCSESIEKAFGPSPVLSAREITERMGEVLGGPEFDRVMIRKPVSRADINTELSSFTDFLSTVHQELISVHELRLGVYRK